MDDVKLYKGITLIALVIAIIILLIIAGVSVSIFYDSFIDRAELTSSELSKISIKEKIELIYNEMQISKYSNEREILDFKSEIEKLEGVENVKFTQNSDESFYTEFDYNNRKYAFIISEENIKETDLVLKGHVKVGDYVFYPVEYDVAYNNSAHFDASNGWRVIDDGIMPGTSGDVRIISSKIPAKFYYKLKTYNNDVNNAIEELTNNFANTNFINVIDGSQVKGDSFIVSSLSKGVTTLTLENLNYAHNAMYETERAQNSVDVINENDDLFRVNGLDNYYWIASKRAESNIEMYCMSQGGITSDSGMRLGIRPVVILKDNLKGKKIKNVWMIN